MHNRMTWGYLKEIGEWGRGGGGGFPDSVIVLGLEAFNDYFREILTLSFTTPSC